MTRYFNEVFLPNMSRKHYKDNHIKINIDVLELEFFKK